MNAPLREPSFRESVDLMFNRAVRLMDLSPGLEEKIRVCNSTYTVRFAGWSAADSAPLLQHLYTHSTRDAFTCRFRWTADTLAIWDNRSTQHNALNDYRGHRRELHRTTVAGTTPAR